MASRLEMIKERFFDNSGNVLAGGYVYSYKVGETEKKTLYTDATGDTEQENPIELNAYGMAASDIYGDGYYKLVIKDSAGATIKTIPSIAGTNESSFTTIGDYSNDMDSAIAALNAASGGGHLYIDATATVTTTTLTIDSDVAITVLEGGSISGAAAITFGGPLNAGPYQIFNTNVTGVTFSNGYDIWADWFGSGKNYTTLDNMNTVIGSSNNVTVRVSPQAWTVGTTGLSLNDNISLDIDNGCVITVSGGKTFTVGGFVDAGAYHIFTVSGILTLQGNDTAYAEWFGDIDGTADDAQIQEAIDALRQGGEVRLLAKTYTLAASIDLDTAIHLHGSGNAYNITASTGTVLAMGTNDAAITVTDEYGAKISDLSITGNSDTDDGISFESNSSYPKFCTVENVSIYDVGGSGIYVSAGSNIVFDRVSVYGNRATAVTDTGFRIEGASTIEDISVRDCRVYETIDHGFKIENGTSISIRDSKIDSVDDPADTGTGVGILIPSGDSTQVSVSDTVIIDSGLYGVHINGGTSDIEGYSFKNMQITLLGSRATERAIQLDATTGSVKRAYFKNIMVSKTGSTQPAYTIEMDSLVENCKFEDIDDSAIIPSSGAVNFASTTGHYYTNTEFPRFVALANDATPPVQGAEIVRTGGQTAITNFDDGVSSDGLYSGQVLTVMVRHTVTFTHSADLDLFGDIDFEAQSGDVIQLMYDGPGNKWAESFRKSCQDSPGVKTLDSNTTPSVKDGKTFTPGSETDYTNFDDAYSGKVITIIGNSTSPAAKVKDGGSIKLYNNEDITLSDDRVVQFVYDGSIWYEISATQN